MEDNTFGNSLVNVIKFLFDNKGKWITDDEITNIAPQYGDKIIEKLIANDAVITTKDGILFDDDCFEALKRYLTSIGININ